MSTAELPEPARRRSALSVRLRQASNCARRYGRGKRRAECRVAPSTQSSHRECCFAASPATKESKGHGTTPRQRPAAAFPRKRRQSRASNRHENPSNHFASAPSSSFPPRTSPQSMRDGATADESPLQASNRRQRSEFLPTAEPSNESSLRRATTDERSRAAGRGVPAPLVSGGGGLKFSQIAAGGSGVTEK